MFESEIKANTLYIILLGLRTEQGINKYHWCLYTTNTTKAVGPAGTMFHVTNEGRHPLDEKFEVRNFERYQDIGKFGKVVVCLKIADSPTRDRIYSSVKDMEHLSNFSPTTAPKFPENETWRTSLVFVKAALRNMASKKLIVLPASPDIIEARARQAADNHRTDTVPKVFNDLSWMTDVMKPAGFDPRMDYDAYGEGLVC